MYYIATIFLILMAAGMATCAVLLWKRRAETDDHSRTIQAILSGVSAVFAVTFIFRTWMGTAPANGAYFEPEHVFVPILIQMTFFFYPLEVIRPLASRGKVYATLFSPLLAVAFIGLFSGIGYTPIHSYDDLLQHLGEFNVWFRLLAMVGMLFYTFALFLVPYDWHHSSADRKFILRYASGFCLMGLLFFAIEISHVYVFVLLHQVVWMSFFFWVAWYELKERLLSPAKYETLPVAETNPDDDELWQKIVHLMDEEEGWFNPEITQADLATKLLSNRTYIADAFKRNTGMTFKDYQTKRRVDFMVQQLQLNPQTDMQDLFFRVGYRDRSTAWRNFRKVMGMSPTEFLETLK